MPAESPTPDRGLLYATRRAWQLRLATLAVWLLLAFCVCLLGVIAVAEWGQESRNDLAWWLAGGGLVALTLTLSAALFCVHDRYVERVVLVGDGSLRVTTFLVWGRRTQSLHEGEVAARRFLLDPGGEAPMGFDTLSALGFRGGNNFSRR